MSIRAQIDVLPVEVGDLARCAEIMNDAFHGDHVHNWLYPSHLAKHELTREERFRRRGIDFKKLHFDSDDKIMLKAVDTENGAIVGFCVWVKPGIPIKVPGENDDGETVTEDKAKEEEQSIEEDKDHEISPESAKAMGYYLPKKRKEILGNTPHWYLVLLLIDPIAQGKGVGGRLLGWGLEHADSANPPLSVALEASPAGQPVYEKKHFKTEGWIHLPGVEKPMPFMVRPPQNTTK